MKPPKTHASKIRVLVFPLNRETGYQQPLYREVAAQGVQVRYGATATSSHTLNLLIIPLSLIWHRLHGFKIWHIHWTYTFSTVWSRHGANGRHAMQLWYNICLRVAHILGFKIIWTAHNVLPHARVFFDDVAARRLLTHLADAVIAHQEIIIPQLEALGARNIHVIPAGSYSEEYRRGIRRDAARRQLGLEPDDRVVVFVGNIVPYKQVDWLIKAAMQLPSDDRHLRIVIAGDCRDSGLRAELQSMAAQAGRRVIASFDYVPDDDLQVYFAAADIAALPFSRITSSGSAILALSFGVPLILPELPELAQFPDSVTIRYPPNFDALVDVLEKVSSISTQALSQLSDGANKFVESLSWKQSGQATVKLYSELVSKTTVTERDADVSTLSFGS